MLLIWIKKNIFFSFLSFFQSVGSPIQSPITFYQTYVFSTWNFGFTKYNGNVIAHLHFKLCANSDNRINKIVRDKIWWWTKTILIWLPHLMIYRHGPLLKILSKIYLIILVKRSGWAKYDLTIRLERTICGCGPRLIIVSNSYCVLSASILVWPNTITIRRTIEP